MALMMLANTWSVMFLIPAIAIYLISVHLLRHQRAGHLEKRFGTVGTFHAVPERLCDSYNVGLELMYNLFRVRKYIRE